MLRFKFCSPREPAPPSALVINVTSRSTGFGRKFSPMIWHQGGIEICGLRSYTVENLWQYTKVYASQVTDAVAWRAWRDLGLASKRAVRYPMGKGAVPEFSYLVPALGRLDYVTARRLIYIPAYEQQLECYCQAELEELLGLLKHAEVWLWDFDVYDPGRLTFEEILADPTRKMGHGFVLANYMQKRWG